jgi:hypothetical protein
MSNEILDYNHEVQNEREGLQVVNWLGIILLWIGIGLTPFFGYFNLTKLIAAIILLLIATISMRFNFLLGVKITFFVALIGAVNFVDFFPFKYIFAFSILGIGLGFELILLLVTTVHFLTNRVILMEMIRDIFQSRITEGELVSARRSKVNSFKRRFSGRSLNELESIITNDKLVPEAIQAAEELLEEKRDK